MRGEERQDELLGEREGKIERSREGRELVRM